MVDTQNTENQNPAGEGQRRGPKTWRARWIAVATRNRIERPPDNVTCSALGEISVPLSQTRRMLLERE